MLEFVSASPVSLLRAPLRLPAAANKTEAAGDVSSEAPSASAQEKKFYIAFAPQMWEVVKAGQFRRDASLLLNCVG